MSRHLATKVGSFHRAAAVPRFATLNATERMVLVCLRAVLLMEESEEVRRADADYRRASTEDHAQHLAKELADLLYVAVGTADVLSTPLTDPRSGFAIPQFFAEGSVSQKTAAVTRSLNLLAHQTTNDWSPLKIQEEIDGTGSEIQDLVQAIFDLAAVYAIPLIQVFDEVHRSNMSKLDDNGRAVYREDGKILKGPRYTEPDLSFVTTMAA